METVHYEIVEHDGGWAYRVGDVYSETFPSRDEAVRAATDAAEEQELPGPAETIEYQDEDGDWHEETVAGDDRPQAEVEK